MKALQPTPKFPYSDRVNIRIPKTSELWEAFQKTKKAEKRFVSHLDRENRPAILYISVDIVDYLKFLKPALEPWEFTELKLAVEYVANRHIKSLQRWAERVRTL